MARAGGPLGRSRLPLRALLLLRVEEWLTLAAMLAFWIIEHLRLGRFDLWTQFFREGLILYLGLAGLVVLLQAHRTFCKVSSRGLIPGALPGGVGRLGTWTWGAKQVLLAALRFLRDWAPFVLLLTIYENLIWQVARLNPRLHDAALQALDDLLLLGHTTFWLERFVTPARTEWFSFFYNVLFVYPVLVGGALYLLRRFVPYRRWVLSFSLMGYLGYLGYLAVPVIGPAYYFESVYQKDLHGRLVNLDMTDPGLLAEPQLGEAQEGFYELALRLNSPKSFGHQVPRNCFPSLHTAWGILILVVCYRHLRGLFWILLFPVLNLIAATVYLRFHYVVDLVAGAMLCLFTLTLVPRLLALEERVQRFAGGRSLLPGQGSPTDSPTEDYRARVRARPWRVAAGLGLPLLFFLAVGAYLWLAPPEGEGRVRVRQEIVDRHLLDALPEGITHPLGARFGEALVLEGVDLDRGEAMPGDRVRVVYYWRAIGALQRNWKVFVHVECRGRQNHDHHPLFGLLRMSELRAGTILRDPQTIHLGPALGEGELRIWVGLFDEHQVMSRMPLTNPAQVVNDGQDRVLAASLRLAGSANTAR